MGATQLLQYLLSGVTTGSIYAIVGIGFNIIYNSTGIINFAQGEFLMLGGMIAITLGTRHAAARGNRPGGCRDRPGGRAAADRLHLVAEEPEPYCAMIIITIGLSILVREAALHVWDEKVRALPFWTGDETTSVAVLGARISPQVLWVLGRVRAHGRRAVPVLPITLTGRAMRACASNATAARLCGIRASTLVTLSFFLAAAMGALAGCVVSPLTQTQYDMGTSLAVKGFTCAVLGGLGNVTAAVAAGLLVGVLETASIMVLPLAYKDVVALAIMLAILFFRPEGLFAGIARSRSDLMCAYSPENSPPAARSRPWSSVSARPLRAASSIPTHPAHDGRVLHAGDPRPVPAHGIRGPGVAGPRGLLRHRRLHGRGASPRRGSGDRLCAVAFPAGRWSCLSGWWPWWSASRCFRLRGHYLAMATLAFGFIVSRVILGTALFGQADGISDIPAYPSLRRAGPHAESGPCGCRTTTSRGRW